MPAFLLGKGNPAYVGWFWFGLFLLCLYIFYKISRSLLNEDFSLLGTVLLSGSLSTSIKELFNPFGAVVLFPVFIYLFISYLKNNKWQYLLAVFFTLGLIIQFQMAFGIPVLFLTVLYLMVYLYKKNKLIHLLSLIILVIPLSTFIIFDLRHDFIQSRSVLDYLRRPESQSKIVLLPFLITRFKGFYLEGINFLKHKYWFIALITSSFTLWFSYVFYRKNRTGNLLYGLFLYFYVGFWIITLLFKGTIWGYYYWPFLPFTIIVFCSLLNKVKNQAAIYLAVLIVALSLYGNFKAVKETVNNVGKDGSSWKFNLLMIEKIFNSGNNEFGYYIFSPDLFGYSQQYAFNYLKLKYPNIKAVSFEKRPLTYLVYVPPPSDRLYLDGRWWKDKQVRINKQPATAVKYPNGFRVEKYILNNKDIDVPSDQNLIKDIYFR